MTGDDPFLRQRIAAAERHAQRLLHGIAGSSTPDRPWAVGLARFPTWLITAWNHHLDQMTVPGHGFKCCHLDLDVPEVSHVAVWAPGITVCTVCVDDGALQVLSAERGEQAARTCDACGTYIPVGLHIAAWKHQFTLIWFGVCATCRDDLHVTPDPDHAVAP